VSHWTFIVASYALTAIATIGLTWASWTSMRRAERDAEALRTER
jgi:putative component of membrane protein insertase Oxa1/YidC/SpoIIIJ protein YidD